MRVLDKTIVTEDEGYDPAGNIADIIKAWLEKLNIDSYNKRYAVRVTVDRIDQNEEAEPAEPVVEDTSEPRPDGFYKKSIEQLRQEAEALSRRQN